MAKTAIKEIRKPAIKKASARRKLRDKDSIFRLHELAVDMGITDLAENFRHNLYGTPKQSESEAPKSGIIGQEETGMAKTAVNEKISPAGRVSPASKGKREKAWHQPLLDLAKNAKKFGPADLAENYEHYLYGGPKQGESD
jgi:hypothetical protein